MYPSCPIYKLYRSHSSHLSTKINYDMIPHLSPREKKETPKFPAQQAHQSTATRPDQNHSIGIDLRSSFVYPSSSILPILPSIATDLCICCVLHHATRSSQPLLQHKPHRVTASSIHRTISSTGYSTNPKHLKPRQDRLVTLFGARALQFPVLRFYLGCIPCRISQSGLWLKNIRFNPFQY
jgi:hypothetical protein